MRQKLVGYDYLTFLLIKVVNKLIQTSNPTATDDFIQL